MRTRPRTIASVLPWALCGLSLGIAAGFLASEMLGTSGHRRLGDLFRRGNHRHPPHKVRTSTIARVREALAGDPALAQHAIEVRSRGHHRGLELRGWVLTRAARSHAHRVARAAAGELDVANRLLVRGEDDRSQVSKREDVPRPA